MDAAATSVTVTRVRFPALDGYSLGGFLHVTPDMRPSHAVVFAPGAGIRAEVYKHFLSYLASEGIAVLAFDYRGIGESRPSRLRGFVAGFEDWAEYDAGGAIAWMAARYPGARLTGMGHSIGSLLIGAAGGAGSLTQVVLICPHTGYHNDYSWSLRLAVRLCWRVIGPTLRATLGYFPSSKLGFGEDLPSRIALQWAARSQSAFAIGLQNGDKDRETRILEHAKSLCVPALVISVEDDAWATEAGVRRLLHVYRNLTIIRRSIASTVRKGRPLGHSGFFRRSQRELHWKQVVRFMHGGTNNASIRTQAKAEAQ